MERFWKHVHGRVGRMAGGRGDSSSDDDDDLVPPRHRVTTSSTTKSIKVRRGRLVLPMRCAGSHASMFDFVDFPPCDIISFSRVYRHATAVEDTIVAPERCLSNRNEFQFILPHEFSRVQAVETTSRRFINSSNTSNSNNKTRSPTESLSPPRRVSERRNSSSDINGSSSQVRYLICKRHTHASINSYICD